MDFQKEFTDRLFVAENQSGDRGFIAFAIPANATPPTGDPVSLKDALGNSDYLGTFVFGARSPKITNLQEAEDFLGNVFAVVPASTRQFIWLTDPENIAETTVFKAQINSEGTVFQTALDARLTRSLGFRIQGGMPISLDTDDSTLLFDGSTNQYQIEFSGPSKPDMQRVTQGKLSLSGSLRGCVRFTGYIQRTSLQNDLQWGFQFLIPNSDDHDAMPLSEWLPFADPTNGPTDYIGFNISIDPSDPYNDVFNPSDRETRAMAEAYASRRTFFDFTGKDFSQRDVTLMSFYRTTFGAKVILVPCIPGASSKVNFNARLVISPGERISSSIEHFHLCPEGDFILVLPVTERYNHNIRCGLAGTEFFNITPQANRQNGDILRFVSRKPAYVPAFPFPAASPVGPPTDLTASPFERKYRTSWATMVASSGKPLSYVSQPKGAALYGCDSLIEPTFNDLFGHTAPAFQFSGNDTDFFPMVPYDGIQTEQNPMLSVDSQDLEKTVISPQRRIIVSSLCKLNAGLPVAGDTKFDTTPSGLIAKTIQSDGMALKWEEVLLGWNEDWDEGQLKRFTLAFEEPPDPLVNALQSSDVFLVAANNKNVGTFQNTMSLSGWKMQVNIGTGQKYDDYRNVMIIKGCKGKLYDPEHPSDGLAANPESLVANPKKWTQAQAFASPKTDDEGQNSGDDAQLVILSQWLQTYFENAYQQKENPYFKKFNEIATSDSWTGILFLRIDIDTKKMPDTLKGIMAGVTEREAFNAHHLGIEINPVEKGAQGPVVDQPTSIFGLIYYVDPDFSDTQPAKSIAPTNSDDYNFRLLSLKVLFENTAVKSFESYAQVTLNQLFGSTVTKTRDPENIYKNVLLAGSLQINNGKAVYSLGSQNDDAFYFDNNIINKVEITDVLLSTRSGDDAATVVSWFGMTGFVDYFKLEDQSEAPFDIFSFGNKLGEDLQKKGLHYSNLGIRMSFPADDPDNSQLAFDASEIAFDLSLSTPRENSLYPNMVLELESLVIGSKDKGPKESGYLDVIPDLRLGGVGGGDWYGLRFKVNMGTPGELAGKVNLDSYLLLSWSPDSNAQSGFKAGVGISLPGTGGGAKLISLQNVMKLSIGQIRLMYIDKQKSFLLLFTEIALKFLGLLKIPPSGSLLFYLFGNPRAGGKASGLGWYAMYAKESREKNVLTGQAGGKKLASLNE